MTQAAAKELVASTKGELEKVDLVIATEPGGWSVAAMTNREYHGAQLKG